MKRFFKVVATLKPQRPRYDYIWDQFPVIDYLATLFPHEDLLLKLSSGKSVTLPRVHDRPENADSDSHTNIEH